MTTFWTDELQAELPEGFADQSIHLLEWKVEGSTVSLTIQRDVDKKRLSPAGLLEATRSEYERRFPHFFPEPAPELDTSLEHRVLAFRWMRDGQAVYQIQCFLELGDRMLVTTSSGPARTRDFVDELTQRFVQTLELRDR